MHIYPFGRSKKVNSYLSGLFDLLPIVGWKYAHRATPI